MLWLGVGFGFDKRGEVRDPSGLQSATFGGGNCRPAGDVDEGVSCRSSGLGGFATLSVGVCKNEPANEPSELATPLHRNGDA